MLSIRAAGAPAAARFFFKTSTLGWQSPNRRLGMPRNECITISAKNQLFYSSSEVMGLFISWVSVYLKLLWGIIFKIATIWSIGSIIHLIHKYGWLPHCQLWPLLVPMASVSAVYILKLANLASFLPEHKLCIASMAWSSTGWKYVRQSIAASLQKVKIRHITIYINRNALHKRNIRRSHNL